MTVLIHLEHCTWKAIEGYNLIPYSWYGYWTDMPHLNEWMDRMFQIVNQKVCAICHVSAHMKSKTVSHVPKFTLSFVLSSQPGDIHMNFPCREQSFPVTLAPHEFTIHLHILRKYIVAALHTGPWRLLMLEENLTLNWMDTGHFGDLRGNSNHTN